MKNIGINVNTKKDPHGKILKHIMRYIDKSKYKVYIFKDGKDLNDICKILDFIISVGGDGTVIGTARMSYEYSVPIFGLNCGNLGFLTTAEKNNIDSALKKLFLGKYYIEKRMMLQFNIIGNNKTKYIPALNEIVISRSTVSKAGEYKVWIDDHFFNNYISDGIIISTPTGSTAYSLSAGGPIILPTMSVIAIVPICPIFMNMRSSFIINSSSVIKVKLNEKDEDAYITIDGQNSYKLDSESIIEIKKSPIEVKLIKINGYNYYDNLRKKIIFRNNECEGD